MNFENLSDSKKQLLAKLANGKLRVDRIPKRVPGEYEPLSFAQSRIWFLDQLVPGSSIYNMHEAVQIKGPIDPVLLGKAFSEMISRHEILRTTFTTVNQEPLQKIHPPYEVELPIENVTTLGRALEIAHEEIVRPFDLEEGPLLRLRLIRLGEENHILLWTMHHIISDGWSLGIIIRELMVLLKAFAQNLPSPLDPLPIQYSDFAIWQKQWLDGPILENQISYWKKELVGDFPPLDLPYDYPRPAILANKGKRKLTQYPPVLMERLTSLATKCEATLFMVLLAAWKILLYRYSAAQNIFVGIPIANRNRTETADLIGFFTNTLVIRTDIRSDFKFLEFVKQVKSKCLSAYQHQDVPFERIVEILHPKRELNGSAFFQVMFVLQNQTISKVEEENLIIEPVEIHNGTCKFDLLLNIYENQIGIEYNTELFSDRTVTQLLDHYRSVLEAIVEDPDLSISEIPLLSQVEKQKILYDWNQTEVHFDFTKTIVQSIEEQVAKTPLKISIEDERKSLTYEQLNACANHLAEKLIQLGVKSNQIIAVYIPRSIEQVICLLAILKAGGAFLPLDTEYPVERILAMIDDSKTSILLYNETLPSTISNNSYKLIDISSFIFQKNIVNPNLRATPENLAYVIYTSGSTGKPNGVMISHAGICNRLLWMQKQYPLEPIDRVLQKTSCSFDVSVWEFFWPLMTGARLVIAPPNIQRDPSELSWFIQLHEISVIHFVPSMLRLFLKELAQCLSLRLVFCSGEELSKDLTNRFIQLSRAKLHNLYGPTEASIDVTYWDCSLDTYKPTVPIGRPIANTQIYILDSRMQPVPIGVSGEIYIGGVGVGLGYLNRPELTRIKFIPSPFIGGKVLYKTGDLARFWENGEIEFLGRVDDQVKVRGVRIELSEIDQALLAYPGVQSAVSVLKDQYLCSYVVSSSNLINSKELVGSWQTVFEDTYLPTQSDSSLLNTIGWNSSYTGSLISEEEMKEWVDDKVEKILKFKPKKILEIGCGTGMLLFRLAEQSESYVGTDISQNAITLISNAISSTSIDSKKVRLFQCEAIDFSLIENETFDMVILNSVVQYFPSLEYFFEVLRKAVSALDPNGSIFLGDLRNLALMESFYQSILLRSSDEKMSVKELLIQTEQKKKKERELFIDPGLFKSLSGVHAEVFLQKGKHANEMSLFRYSAILTSINRPFTIQSDQLRGFANIPYDMRGQELLLKKFLRTKLPEYMIPSHIIFLDRLPLSLNGKLAKKELPNPTIQKTIPIITEPALCLPLEKIIIEIWMEVLNLSHIQKEDNFFDLGGHSLSAAVVILKLNDRLNKQIPLRLLFQFPTVESLARSIESQGEINQTTQTWARMLQDSFLPASIAGTASSSLRQQRIFLTGATGFLGAYLLRELLSNTHLTLYCLVRGKDYEEAEERLRKNLAYYCIFNEIDFSRVNVVLGDLAQEKFGLSNEQYDFYAQEIDTIYHCAAQVSFADTYENLCPSNVYGTVEILRFAVAKCTKSVHYVSTIHVLTKQDQELSGELNESVCPRHGQLLQMGYLQTKWVAERLILSAKERNIPVSIYRVGRLGGDMQTGACQQNDFYWSLIRACIKMGKISDIGFDEKILPVDIAGQAIVRLSRLPIGDHQTYHILNPKALSQKLLVSCIRERGYQLEECSAEEWRQAIQDHLNKDMKDPASALAGFLSNQLGEEDPVFFAEATLQKMEDLGITIPDDLSQCVSMTINFFVETHFFPDIELAPIFGPF